MAKILLTFFLLINTLFALDLMTEDYPPYNYANANGVPAGLVVDVVTEIIKETGDKNNIKLLPWARSYRDIQTKNDKVLFSMTRTPAREHLFKWVGPVATNTLVLFAKKGTNIKVSSLDDVKKLNYSIGTYLGDIGELLLKENGFTNLQPVPDDILNIKKLLKNRINLWIVGEISGIYKAKKLNNAHKQLEKVLEVKKTEFFIAFSKTTSDNIINQWQNELDKLKKNGTYKTIMDKLYITEFIERLKSILGIK